MGRRSYRKVVELSTWTCTTFNMYMYNFGHDHVHLWAWSCWTLGMLHVELSTWTCTTFNMDMYNFGHDHVHLWAWSCPTFNMFPNKEIALKFLFRIWHLPIFWNFSLLNLYLPIFGDFPFPNLEFTRLFGWKFVYHISRIWFLNFYKKFFLTSPENFPSKDYLFINCFFLLEKKAFMIIYTNNMNLH